MINCLVKCCAADCRFRNAVAKALEQSCDAEVTDILSRISPVKVLFRCTKCGETYMHESCYQRVEEQLCTAVRTNSSTLNEAEISKTIFDTSRSGKFDMVRNHPVLTCSCKMGKLCAMTEGRKVIKIGEDQTIEKKKKKKKYTSPQKTAQKQLFTCEYDEEELDEEQASYIYRRPEQQIQDELVSCHIAAEDFTDMEFPDLPPNALPPPLCRQNHRSYQPTSSLDFRIQNRGSFHTLTLSSASSENWKPRVIGKQGTALKIFIEAQKKHGVNVDRIYIENDQHGITRIIINGKYSDDRECCAYALQHKIEKIMCL
tara:strand:- start:6127 stop:7071 length:945 start_codon:yes stop_codon:yes gene_type:complete